MPSNAVQQFEFGADAAFRERGGPNAEAVRVEQPLHGVFKHAGCLRGKAVKFTGIQDVQKFLFLIVCPSVPGCARRQRGRDRLTDFFLTAFFFSFFFLTGQRNWQF